MYQKGLLNWYDKNRDELMAKYSKLSECEHGEGASRALSVAVAPEYYDFCPSSNDDVGDSFEPQNADVDTELQR